MFDCNFGESNTIHQPPSRIRTMIAFDNVAKRYPNGREALAGVSFTIQPGETTVLEVSSVIRKENTFLLKFFVPEVSVNVVANGVGFDAVPINLRGDASVAWDDYSGPLKFVAK